MVFFDLFLRLLTQTLIATISLGEHKIRRLIQIEEDIMTGDSQRLVRNC